MNLPVVNAMDDWKEKCKRPSYKEMPVTDQSKWNKKILTQIGGFNYHEAESFATMKFENHNF